MTRYSIQSLGSTTGAVTPLQRAVARYIASSDDDAVAMRKPVDALVLKASGGDRIRAGKLWEATRVAYWRVARVGEYHSVSRHPWLTKRVKPAAKAKPRSKAKEAAILAAFTKWIAAGAAGPDDMDSVAFDAATARLNALLPDRRERRAYINAHRPAPEVRQERLRLPRSSAHIPRRDRRTYDPSKLIRSAGGWPQFEWTAEEAGHLEQRDADAIKKAIAAGPPKPCDIDYRVTATQHSITVRAHKEGREVGHLTASRNSAGFRTLFTVGGASIDSYKVLANCPGVGTKMYEAAARAACKQGAALAGSSYRSAFSQGFWGRQIDKGRATCYGAQGSVYRTPMNNLRDDLRGGRVTVPQYNQLVANLPDNPHGDWPCTYIPLDNCKGDKKKPTLPVDNTLRGLRKRLRR